jgi:hypothetical protein
LPEANSVASFVLGKSTWAVLALTCHIELFVLAHYRGSIDEDPNSSELWKDVFLYHWREESQHAILDEIEWQRENARLSPEERDAGVNDLIELIAAVDGMVQTQARADADYFAMICGRSLPMADKESVCMSLLAAYRWQYIISGVQEPRFSRILSGMITGNQVSRIGTAMAPIMS